MEYHTIERRAKNITVAIYVTEEEITPKYVDDKGCRKLGEFVNLYHSRTIVDCTVKYWFDPAAICSAHASRVYKIWHMTKEYSSFQYGKRWFFW
jgi:hypothetical protein